ncbi:hypothetical protein LOD99_7348 [Oopsacas minuta]|uniref:Uncharacterized protein n=1 Tax=Oopsacas minuta TaxID=111878 RepID=A0AAV7JTT5_9METZ|nr:hypothetical protein LOD99_7348 [Oopsacas minuta]
MEKLLDNLWWYFVTVATLLSVTLGMAWIIQAAKNKYRFVFRCIHGKQRQKMSVEPRGMTADSALRLNKSRRSHSLVRRTRSLPIVIQDPNYVRNNRTNRKSALTDVCSLSTIREEYTPISNFY